MNKRRKLEKIFNYTINNNDGYDRLIRSENNDNYFYSASALPKDSIELNFNEPRSTNQIDFVYYTVKPGDTLHNLSVKYSCPVASIKRLNNLWSDQEFFGLTKVKLPTGKLRLIADVIEEASNETLPNTTTTTSLGQPNNSNNLQSNHETTSDDNIHLYSRQTPFYIYSNPNEELNAQENYVQTISNNDYLGPIDNNNLIRSDSIFRDFDLNIEKARTAALSYNENASAIMQSLAQSGNIVDDNNESNEDYLNDPNKIARREAEILLNDMSDFGLSYSGLILFVFIVCLIFPLAYVIYLEETHNNEFKKIS